MDSGTKATFERLINELAVSPDKDKTITTIEYAARLAEIAAYDAAGNASSMTITRLMLSSAELSRIAQALRNQVHQATPR